MQALEQSSRKALLMTISSSLNAGVAGLAANASKLATIADNIANSSTVGYKRSEADFHSMVISAGSGKYSAGGVRATTKRLIDQPGAMLSTTNATDLAVRGRGFLPVTNQTAINGSSSSYPMLLSTTGSFRTDAAGYLTTETGLVLMGWPAASDGTIPSYPRDTADGLQPIQINVNQFAGEPTTKMTLGVNLPATETDAGSDGTPRTTSIEYYDNLGTSRSVNVIYTPLVPAAGLPSTNSWNMQLSDSAEIDPITGSPVIIGEYDLVFNDARNNGGTLASVTTVSGGAYDNTTGDFTVSVAGGPIEVSIGSLGDGQGITQLSDKFAPTSIFKDGSPVGNMVSVEVDPSGMVYANFDIGITRTIYQIPLIDLPNPNGLTSLDNQTYATSNDSGSIFLWDAGDGPTGDVISFALEESSTDVAGELTQLIQTQRAYSSNAKVIQTVDEMLQETTNIKR
ncbi:MAG: flagellar hook protein FlgE [Paracoccaceae bacterium]|jgi:flagellar hook protein FlgE